MKTTKQLARELGLIRNRSVKSTSVSYTKRMKTYQIFSHLIVIDFEATCWQDKRFRTNEIIEFPAVLIDTSTGQVESEFQYYVQPQEQPILSEFCTELTGITQEQVEQAIPINICLKKFNSWLEKLKQDKGLVYNGTDPNEKLCTFVTWSDWDLGVCLQYECRRKQLRKPTQLNSWIDLRATYRKFYGRKPNGLNGALQDVGIEFMGREHSGLDDARNTAKLCYKMMCDGCVMNITKTLDRKCTLTNNQHDQPQLTHLPLKNCATDTPNCNSVSNLSSNTENSPCLSDNKIQILSSANKTRTNPILTSANNNNSVSSANNSQSNCSLSASIFVGSRILATLSSTISPVTSISYSTKSSTRPSSSNFSSKPSVFTELKNKQRIQSSVCGPNSCNAEDIGCTKFEHKVIDGKENTTHHKDKRQVENGVSSPCFTPTIPILGTVGKPCFSRENRTSTPKFQSIHWNSIRIDKSECQTVSNFSTVGQTDNDTSTNLKTPTNNLSNVKTSVTKMKATPPLCKCGRRSKRRITQRMGENQGRMFFSCPLHYGSKKGCGFFMWEDTYESNRKSNMTIGLNSSEMSSSVLKFNSTIGQPQFDTPINSKDKSIVRVGRI